MEKKNTTTCKLNLQGPKDLKQGSVPAALGAAATELRQRWTIPEIYRNLPLYPYSLNRRPVVSYSFRPRHAVRVLKPKEKTVRPQSAIPQITPRPPRMLHECFPVSKTSCDVNANASIQETPSTFTTAQKGVSLSTTLPGVGQLAELPSAHMQPSQSQPLHLPQNVFFMSPICSPHLQLGPSVVTVPGKIHTTSADSVKSSARTVAPNVPCKESENITKVTYSLAGPFQKMPAFRIGGMQLLHAGVEANSPRDVFGNQSFPVHSEISTPQKNNQCSCKLADNATSQKVNYLVPSATAINKHQHVCNTLPGLTQANAREATPNSSAAFRPPQKAYYTVDPMELTNVTTVTEQFVGQSERKGSVMETGGHTHDPSGGSRCAAKGISNSAPGPPLVASAFYDGSEKEGTNSIAGHNGDISEPVCSPEVYLSSPDSLPPEDIEDWEKLDISKGNGLSPCIEIDVAEDGIGPENFSLSRESSNHESSVLLQSELLKGRKTCTRTLQLNQNNSTRRCSRVSVSKTTPAKTSRRGRKKKKEISRQVSDRSPPSSGRAKVSARRSKRLISLALNEDGLKNCTVKPPATKRNKKLRKVKIRKKTKRSPSSSLHADMKSSNLADTINSSSRLDKLRIVPSSDNDVDEDLPAEEQNINGDAADVCLTQAKGEDVTVNEKGDDQAHEAVTHTGNGRWKDEMPVECAEEQADDSGNFPMNGDGVSFRQMVETINNNIQNRQRDENTTCHSLSGAVDCTQHEGIPQLTAMPAIFEAVDNTIQSIGHSTVHLEKMCKALDNLIREKNTCVEDYFVSGLSAILNTGRHLNDNMISSLQLFVSRHRNLVEDAFRCVESGLDVNLPCLTQECPLDLRQVTSGGSDPSCLNRLETSTPRNGKKLEVNEGVRGNGDGSASSQLVKGCVVKLTKLSPADIFRERSCQESQSWSPLSSQDCFKCGSGRNMEIKQRPLNTIISSSCEALIPVQNNTDSNRPGAEDNLAEKMDTPVPDGSYMNSSENPEMRSAADERSSRLVVDAAPFANTVVSETDTAATGSGIGTLDTRAAFCKERATGTRACCRPDTKKKKTLGQTEINVDQTIENPSTSTCNDARSSLSEDSENGSDFLDGREYPATSSLAQTSELPKLGNEDFQWAQNCANKPFIMDLSRRTETSSECRDEVLVTQNARWPKSRTKTTGRRCGAKMINRGSPMSTPQRVDGETSETQSDVLLGSDGQGFLAYTGLESKTSLEKLFNLNRGEFSECTKHHPPCRVSDDATEPLPCDLDQIFGEKYSNLSPDSSSSESSLGTQERKTYPKGGESQVDGQKKAVSKNTQKSHSVRYKRKLALGVTSDMQFPSQAGPVDNQGTCQELRERGSKDTDNIHNDQTTVTHRGRRRGRPPGVGHKRKVAVEVSPSQKKRRSRGRTSVSNAFQSTATSDGSESELRSVKRKNAESVPFPLPDVASAGVSLDESSSEEIIRPRKRRGLSEERRQSCFKVLDRVYNFAWSEPFRFEIRRDQVPDYFNVVKNPMYFRLIASKLRKGDYSSVQEFVCDMKLVFDNCRLYHRSNPLQISPKLLVAATMVEGYLAKELRRTFPDIDISELMETAC